MPKESIPMETPSRKPKPFLAYCPEGNMFVYANQTRAPKFTSHTQFLGGVKSLKSGNKLKTDIKADSDRMKTIYKADNPFIPSYLKPKMDYLANRN
eukprot:UN02939